MLSSSHLEHHPPNYSFLLALTPDPFLGLAKFMAGRIYQIRDQKSYVAVHSFLSFSGVSHLCPLCREEQETFSHTILRFLAKAASRSRHR